VEPDEQATSLGPCERHPGKPSVATCDECGRPLCLTCAVPVRGRVLGPGCLSRELGPELAPSPPAPAAGRPILLVTGIGFAAAAISTALPWKKFGEGSGPLGAWGLAPRWSILAGVAALLGLLVWATVSLRGRRPGTKWAAALRLLAILVASGAVLHLQAVDQVNLCFPVEVFPYTDPWAPFNPQHPHAPRGDHRILVSPDPQYPPAGRP